MQSNRVILQDDFTLFVLPGDQHPGLFPPPSHEGHLSGSAQVRAAVHPPARPPSSMVFCSAPPTGLHLFISHLPSAVTTCSEANSFPSRRVTGRTGKPLCRPQDGPDQHQREKPRVNWKQEDKRQVTEMTAENPPELTTV